MKPGLIISQVKVKLSVREVRWLTPTGTGCVKQDGVYRAGTMKHLHVSQVFKRLKHSPVNVSNFYPLYAPEKQKTDWILNPGIKLLQYKTRKSTIFFYSYSVFLTLSSIQKLNWKNFTFLKLNNKDYESCLTSCPSRQNLWSTKWWRLFNWSVFVPYL